MTASANPSSQVGAQRRERLDVHEGRNALSCLLANIFDAWDDDDADHFASQFTSHAQFVDRKGARHDGVDSIHQAFVRWKATESMSVHWFSNEDARQPDDHLRGTGLWLSASTEIGTGLAYWSGGDTIGVARQRAGRWLLSSLFLTDRFRTSYEAGWLVEPHAPWAEAVPIGRTSVFTVGTTRDARPVYPPDEARVELLIAESEVRTLINAMSSAVEAGGPARELAVFFEDDVRFATSGPGVMECHVEGVQSVASLLADEQRVTATWIRPVMSVATAAHLDRPEVTCRWRDLWTAEVGGQARWLAHRYRATAMRHGNVWRLTEITRVRTLDCAYRKGWT